MDDVDAVYVSLVADHIGYAFECATFAQAPGSSPRWLARRDNDIASARRCAAAIVDAAIRSRALLLIAAAESAFEHRAGA